MRYGVVLVQNQPLCAMVSTRRGVILVQSLTRLMYGQKLYSLSYKKNIL